MIDINGNLIDPDGLEFSPMDVSTYYGLSVYETMFVKNGRVAFYGEHYNRLAGSTGYFKIQCPDYDGLKNRIQKLIKVNQLDLARIRLIVSGGNYRTFLNQSGYSSIITFEKISGTPNSIRLCTTHVKKPEPYFLPPGIKISANLFSLLSYREAKERGFDEGIMLTDKNHISEGSYCNLFWEKDSEIYTPSLDSSILDGVTRAKIISVCRNKNIPCYEGKFTLESLNDCERLYISSSTRGLLPVLKCNEKNYPTEETTLKRIVDSEYERELEKSLDLW